jgi:hypothetical protein
MGGERQHLISNWPYSVKYLPFHLVHKWSPHFADGAEVREVPQVRVAGDHPTSILCPLQKWKD